VCALRRSMECVCVVQVVLCASGRVGEGAYVDSKALKVVRVSFADGVPRVEGDTDSWASADVHVNADLGDLRGALAAEASAYAARVFADHKGVHGGGDAFAPVGGPRGGSVVVVLSGLKPNLRNFWAARWSSEWVVTPASGGDAARVEGSISMHSHYFENGNMQMKGARPVAAVEVRPKRADGSLAKAVLEHIQTVEEEVHAALQETYAAMDREALKEIRRFLTVAGTGFSWNIFEVRNKSALGGKK